ncbi:hypothetical protein OBE_10762, partial [human gut metagenome]
PICLDTQDTEEIIETVVRIAPAFGGINLLWCKMFHLALQRLPGNLTIQLLGAAL